MSLLSAFAPLPFDQTADPRAVGLVDHFIGFTPTSESSSQTATAVPSTLPWVIQASAGDSIADAARVTGTKNHPGILGLQTGATTPANGDTAHLSLGPEDGDQFVLDENGIYIAALVRIPDVDATRFEFGLYGQAFAAVNSSAADVIAIVFDPEDGDNTDDELFFAQVNGGGTDTEEVLDEVTYTQNRWVLLELAADDAGASFRVTQRDSDTGVLEQQEHNETGATMPTVGLTPYFTVEAVAGAEEQVDIDAFALRYVSRTPADDPYINRIFNSPS